MTASRIHRAQELLTQQKLDLLIVTPSADFRYLTGRRIGPTERLVALLIPQRGRPMCVVPQMTKPLLGSFDASVHTWEDGSDPLDLLVSLIGAASPRQIAVAEELWSGYLIELEARMPETKIYSGASVMHALRVSKDAEEIDLLAESSRRHDMVFDELCTTGKFIGSTEADIATTVRNLMWHHGLTDIAWIDVAAGPNTASPLHAGGDHRIEAGDPVVIDYAGAWNGYFGDICRTPVAGEPSAELTDVYSAVEAAQEAAVQEAGPGVVCEDLDMVARRVISERGYGDFLLHRVGHGIGISPHEHPYLVQGNREVLAPGMAFSIEPGIYVVNSYGVRIEDIVLVTDDGSRRLNMAKRDMTIVS